jgi:hypothetical protein
MRRHHYITSLEPNDEDAFKEEDEQDLWGSAKDGAI